MVFTAVAERDHAAVHEVTNRLGDEHLSRAGERAHLLRDLQRDATDSALAGLALSGVETGSGVGSPRTQILDDRLGRTNPPSSAGFVPLRGPGIA